MRDVAIVGGGLAGAATAVPLARAGADVVVLEKATFPRPKLCGEFLSGEARASLARLGALEAVLAEGPEEISSFSVVREDGRRVSGRLPAIVLSLSRDRLDAIVASAAAAAGAEVRLGVTVTGITGSHARGFRVAFPGGSLDARAVVGAWGRYSPLDGALSRPFFGAPARLFGFKRHLEGDSRRLAGRVVLHLFRGGYLGLSRVERGVVNLAALATTGLAKEARDDLGAFLERLTAASPSLAADLAGLSPVPGPTLVSEPVHLGPRDPVAGDVLLAGDAASVLDPWTGSGMAMALATGEALGPLLLESLSSDDVSRLPAAWRRAHRRLTRRALFFSRILRPVFSGAALSRLVLPAAAPLAAAAARWTRAGQPRRGP